MSKLAYEPTDDIAEASAIILQCPACHWVLKRLNIQHEHAMVLWGERSFRFAGQGYHDLSVLAGRTAVVFTAGACRAHFHIRGGRVDFSDAEARRGAAE